LTHNNGCKTFAASIAQTLVDKQVKFQILSYKLGLGKSLTGLGLKKFKKPWAWTCPKICSTPAKRSVLFKSICALKCPFSANVYA
jgi:hypothetical protein